MAIKHKYRGFIVKKTINDEGIINEERRWVGDTFAISEKQALSNIRFRMVGKKKGKKTYDYNSISVTQNIEVEFVA